MAKHFKIVDLIYASFRPADELWQDTEDRRWLSMAGMRLKDQVEHTIDAIRDQSVPKNILILFFQQWIGGTPLNIIRGYMNEILDEARAQKWNRICFSTCWYTPSHEKVWHSVTDYNTMAQRTNELMGRSRVNIHRAVMSRISEFSYKLRSRLAMWAEPQMGLALGYHLSHEGMKSVLKMVHEVMDTAFSMKKRKRSERSYRDEPDCPPPLSQTPGWNKNKFMRQLLADRGLVPDVRKRGEKRLKMSTQKIPGADSWHVFVTHGPLNRFDEREGILEAIIHLWNRKDKMPVWGAEEDEIEDVVVEEVVDNAVVEGVVDNEVVEDVVKEVVVDGDAVDDGEAPYDPEEWIANSDIEIEFHNDLCVQMPEVEMGVQEMEIKEHDNGDGQEEGEVKMDSEKEKVKEQKVERKEHKEKKRTEKENSNEDQDVEWLLNRLKNTERMVKVQKEKCKVYKKDLEGKEVAVAREKASVKFWKQQYDGKKEEMEKLEAEVQRLSDLLSYEQRFGADKRRK